MDTILVANAGSSSVKFQVFGIGQDGSLKRQIKGQIDGVGSRPRLRATGADGSVLIECLATSIGANARFGIENFGKTSGNVSQTKV